MKENQVLSNDELNKIIVELEKDKPPTAEQLQAKNQEIIQQSVDNAKTELDKSVKDIQEMFLWGAVAIAIIGTIKIIILVLIKRMLKKRKK